MDNIEFLEKLKSEAILKSEDLKNSLMKGNNVDPNKIKEYQKFENIKSALFDLVEMIKSGQIGK